MDEQSAGTIVFNPETQTFLILHYPQGHWDFPKGHLEPGETEEEAALRELTEETSIVADVEKGFRGTVQYKYRKGWKLVHKQVVFFLVVTTEESVSLSHEHTGFEWLPFDRAFKQLTFKNSRDQLSRARKYLEART